MTPAELRERGLRRHPELAELSPSPLERWALPRGHPAEELWVKRDDRLGEGGTKVRKLRVELARARRDGASVLTFGPLDSNHALATAHAAAASGLGARLSIVGDPASDPDRVNRLRAAAPSEFHESVLGAVAGAGSWLMGGLVRGERRRLIPPGGTSIESTAAVALGVAELVEQFQAANAAVPERWVVAVGTGGTLAGLAAGLRAMDLRVDLVGVIASSRAVRRPFVAWLANRALAALGCEDRVSRCALRLDDRQLGGGHGAATEASAAVLRDFQALGLPLDPVFTAKAMAEVLASAKPKGRCLFWHTGVSV